MSLLDELEAEGPGRGGVLRVSALIGTERLPLLVPDGTGDAIREAGPGDVVDGARLEPLLTGSAGKGHRVDLAARCQENVWYFQPLPAGLYESHCRQYGTRLPAPEVLVLEQQSGEDCPAQLQSLVLQAHALGARHIVVLAGLPASSGGLQKLQSRWQDYGERVGVTVLVLDADDEEAPHNLKTALQAVAGATDQAAGRALRLLPMGPPMQSELDVRVLSGELPQGASLRALPCGRQVTVERIHSESGIVEKAFRGQHVRLILSDTLPEQGVDLLCEARAPATVARQLDVQLLWLGEEALLPARQYHWRSAGVDCDFSVTDIKYVTDSRTLTHNAAKTLEQQEVAECNVALERDIVFDAVEDNPATSRFSVHEAPGGRLLGLGSIRFALRRSHNITLQHVDVDRASRSQLKGQQPCVVWLTGLSGAGKSTIANLLEKRLFAEGRHTYLLDGDNVRHGLNKDLGFTDADRVENIRRIAEVARLMVDAGLIVITAFISPFRAERQMARELFGDGDFIEVHVDTPLEVAEERDVKGLYRKARQGELKNFTGIDSPYEAPEAAECSLNTADMSAEEAAAVLHEALRKLGKLSS